VRLSWLAFACQAAGEEPSWPDSFPDTRNWLVIENAELKIAERALQAETPCSELCVVLGQGWWCGSSWFS